jgi:hypothetical protein
MKKLALRLSSFLVVLFCLSSADASLLGSIDFKPFFGIWGASSGMEADIGIGIDVGFDDEWILDEKSIIFSDLLYPPASTNIEYLSTAADPNFNRFVSHLTNGVDDFILYYAHPNIAQGPEGAGSGRESNAFFDGSQIDFFGYEISSIGLVVNHYYWASPGSDPNGAGNWTEIDGSVTMNVYGQKPAGSQPVPEPATLFLFGSGLAGLIGMRHKIKANILRKRY